MISLPVDLLGEFTKSVIFAKNLVSLKFGSRTFRLTDCDQNIYYDGWYESHPIEFEAISLGQELEATSLKMTVSNIDRAFSRLILSEDMRNKPVEIKKIYLTRSLSAVGIPILIFSGFTDQISVKKKIAEVEVVDELIKWKTPIPRRIHQDKCTWAEFKGPECRYSGSETWCDRTYARCVALTTFSNVTGAYEDDGGVLTSYTSEANQDTTNDVMLMPAAPVTDDAFYIGGARKFPMAQIIVTTAASTTGFITPWSIAWEYWNGTWASIPGVQDTVNGYKLKGTKTIMFNPPDDWGSTTVSTVNAYWIRGVATVPETTSFARPKASRIYVSHDGQYLNFGGFRFVTELQDKEIWWGRAQKSWINALR